MKTYVYKLVRIGFDELENRDPVYRTLVGYFSTRKVAEQERAKLEKKESKYRGYDGNTYPQYKITEREVKR